MEHVERFFTTTTLLALLAFFAAPAAAAARVPRSGLQLSANSMPTPITKRQQIVDKYKLRLKAIDSSAPALADGYQYQTDVGKNEIDEWPTEYLQDELKTAFGQARIGIFDLVDAKPQQEIRELQVINTLLMQARIYHFRGLTPAELRKIMADVTRALVTDPATGQREPTLGGLLIDMHSSEAAFIVPKESFQIDGAAIGWEAIYLTRPFDEYE